MNEPEYCHTFGSAECTMLRSPPVLTSLHRLRLQGVEALSPSKRQYTLTDPALCTADKRFGRADLGSEAIKTYMAAHTCGPLCSKAGCQGTRV